MTSSVLEGHSPIPSLFNVIFRICDRLRGPSASAKLLVTMFTSDVTQLNLFMLSLHLCRPIDKSVML